MRWIVRSDQAEYMRERQKQNKSKIVEAELWAKKKLKFTGHKWNTQTIWGCRLFDFWCHKLGIAVEIDGLTHDKNYDAARDQYNFYRSGIIVLRVPNYDETAMAAALQTIADADTWEVRKVKMREQYGLQQGQNFSDILKIVGIKKAHGNWSPTA
jgi:very-short-patch-repair endonuclease